MRPSAAIAIVWSCRKSWISGARPRLIRAKRSTAASRSKSSCFPLLNAAQCAHYRKRRVDQLRLHDAQAAQYGTSQRLAGGVAEESADEQTQWAAENGTENGAEYDQEHWRSLTADPALSDTVADNETDAQAVAAIEEHQHDNSTLVAGN
jgi:hypothetical protein